MVEEELPAPPSPECLEKAEGLIRQASLAKIRGDKTMFEKLVQEAATVAPGSSTVQEALGDALVDRRQVKKAKDAFQLAVKLDPKNASAERKFGEAVLSVQLALDPLFSTVFYDDSLASGKAGLILSFLIPGLGQIVSGDTKKGSMMLGGWLIGIAVAVAIPKGISGLGSLINLRAAPPLNPIVFVPLFVAATCWMWSLGDAGSRNKSFQKRTVVRPVPPDVGDFEL